MIRMKDLNLKCTETKKEQRDIINQNLIRVYLLQHEELRKFTKFVHLSLTVFDIIGEDSVSRSLRGL